ncbi:hypothetical protein CRUP_031329, partial [Coryphaenoides rupestris]
AGPGEEGYGWPSGYGAQARCLPADAFRVPPGNHPLTFTAETKVYFRTVELVQEPVPGSPGLSFYFRVNGKAVFMKGSNWIPAHAFQDLVSPAGVRQLLESAVEANMNTLRVRRLKSHPSVVVWSGNNENEAALATDWFSIPATERPMYTRDYVKLYVDNIRALVLEEDPSRPFLVSSPTNGLASERQGWVASDPYDPHYGDTHYYSYTHDCWDWTAFPRTRFASEYGFQSWPSFSTLQKVRRLGGEELGDVPSLPQEGEEGRRRGTRRRAFSSLQKVSVEEDWAWDSRFTAHRQHHAEGNEQMLLQAGIHYHLPNATDPLRRYTHTLYITQDSLGRTALMCSVYAFLVLPARKRARKVCWESSPGRERVTWPRVTSATASTSSSTRRLHPELVWSVRTKQRYREITQPGVSVMTCGTSSDVVQRVEEYRWSELQATGTTPPRTVTSVMLR